MKTGSATANSRPAAAGAGSAAAACTTTRPLLTLAFACVLCLQYPILDVAVRRGVGAGGVGTTMDVASYFRGEPSARTTADMNVATGYDGAEGDGGATCGNWGDGGDHGEDDAGGATDRICGCLSSLVGKGARGDGVVPSASWLWNAHRDLILSTAYEHGPRDCGGQSRPPPDPQLFRDWLGRIHSLLDVSRLRRSVKSPPDPIVTRRLMDVVAGRLADPGANPPLRVAVFGGSVTEGCESSVNPVGLPHRPGGRVNSLGCFHSCAWPRRLERLLNAAILPLVEGDMDGGDNDEGKAITRPERKVVEIVNFGTGGTDSEVGATFLEYNLWPKGHDASKFDVVISAYSSNDYQKTDIDQTYEGMQRFITEARNGRPCDDDLPLVVHLEDNLPEFVGSRDAMATLRVSADAMRLASWNGIAAVSYADAVRDLWYASITDDNEDGLGDETLTTCRSAHPGMGFHVGVSWVVAYNLLASVVDACEDRLFAATPSSPGASGERLRHAASTPPLPRSPLPPLLPGLNHRVIPSQWRSAERRMDDECTASSTVIDGTNVTAAPGSDGAAAVRDRRRTRRPCAFAWVATRQNASTADEIRARMSPPVVTYNDGGWEATGSKIRKPRRTWMATGANATFVVELTDLAVPVERVLVLGLRSYGEMWEGSLLRVTIEVSDRERHGGGPNAGGDGGGVVVDTGTTRDDGRRRWRKVREVHIDGVHDSRTSVNYSNKIVLAGDDGAVEGGAIRATFRLVGGSRFQINGMAFCPM